MGADITGFECQHFTYQVLDLVQASNLFHISICSSLNWEITIVKINIHKALNIAAGTELMSNKYLLSTYCVVGTGVKVEKHSLGSWRGSGGAFTVTGIREPVPVRFGLFDN